MRIDILTLFPDMFKGVLGESIIKRAQDANIVEINPVNLRDFTHDAHRTADDRPFGGGPGMVMKVEPVVEAVEAVISKAGANRVDTRVILLSPQGSKLTQSLAKKIAEYEHIILICGHYEGIDERVRESVVTEEVSIGDYILTCGELPAMVLIDAVVRLMPGVLGNEEALISESFEAGLLEYPQYTRPAEFRGRKVPEVLLSGNHSRIAQWRRKESLARTKQRRPDLLENRN